MLFRINALMVTLVLLLACFVLHVSGGEALPPPTYCPAACAKSPLSSIRRDACCLGYSRGDVARKQYDYVSRDEVDDFALAREGPGRTVDMPHDAASTLLSSSTRRRRGGRCSSSSSSSSSRTSSSSRIAAAVYTSSRKSTQGAPWNRQFTIHHHDGCITLNYYGMVDCMACMCGVFVWLTPFHTSLVRPVLSQTDTTADLTPPSRLLLLLLGQGSCWRAPLPEPLPPLPCTPST